MNNLEISVFDKMLSSLKRLDTYNLLIKIIITQNIIRLNLREVSPIELYKIPKIKDR